MTKGQLIKAMEGIGDDVEVVTPDLLPIVGATFSVIDGIGVIVIQDEEENGNA